MAEIGSQSYFKTDTIIMLNYAKPGSKAASPLAPTWVILDLLLP